MSMKKNVFKRALSMAMAVLMVLSCWVWFEPVETVNAANEVKDKYLFAYFTDNSSAGQTIHLAVSEDGLHYTALRNNEPVIVPSKGTGAVRDPYLWYNEQDNYYYLIATDMDASNNQWWDNCNGFIMWRSKDLVHWYDETFINVYDMLQRFDEPVGIVHRAWAPQIMWDGTSYVIYFSIDTDNVNYPADQLSIVYLKTTDLLNLEAYYEYGGILYPGYDVNDAEIVQHPTNGKWYLFYKPENGNVKINMLVSDNATGPYTSPDANNSAGLDVFSTVNEALEGGNGFFDHNGDFVLYADAFGHGTSYFYVAKTDADGDFKSWTVYGESAHNINSLSPRHGSVVPITTEEYNRLLNNAYGITSSSFPATETLADHLIARYFTTADATYNAVTGKSGELTLHNKEGKIDVGTDKTDTIGYYVKFNADTCYGVDLEEIAGENFNAEDGFTITFTAFVDTASGSNSRFYEISENPGVQTDGKNHYTHFAPRGDNGGAYIGNYNGPSGVEHKWTAASKNYNDGQIHEWIISYANGNTIVYCDGEMIIKMNRFDNGGTNDDAWYAAIRNATLYIGQSGWDIDPLFKGWISDFCIYDCSMSYYDVKNVQNEQDIEAGITGSIVTGYDTFGTAIPSWTHSSTSQMSGLVGTNFQNVLYSPQVTGMPSGATSSSNPTADNGAAAAFSDDGVYFGVYYANNTVVYLDGKNTPKIPVYAAGRNNEMNRDGDMLSVYPINSTSDTTDNKLFSLVDRWKGWNSSSVYHDTIKNPDNITTGHNSSTSGNCDLENSKGWTGSQGDRKIAYIANVLQLNENQVSINSDGYQKVNLSWHFKYNWERYKSGWKGWETRNQDISSGFNIWIVDLREYVATKNEIAANYDSIVTNPDYCPAIVESYKSVVAEIMEFNPSGYNYAGGAEAAIKSCLTQADKLIADYNSVLAELTAHNNGHKTLTIPGRDATCAAPGLTAGSYCEYCGEIFTAQVITDVVPHTFGAVYTVDGIQYVKCSECDLEVKYAPYEVRYENIFDIDRWTYSASNQLVGTGTISANEKKGTITIVNNDSDEIFTRAQYDGQNLVSSRDPGNYAIPVTGGRTYVVEATSLDFSTSSGEIYIFQYDKDGKVFSTIPKVMAINPGETVSAEFTVDPNAAYIELRFDCNEAGKTITYKDIGVYETEERRTYFYPGENKPLLNPTFKDGYAFDGWYTKSGAKIENTNQLSAPVNYVYSHWVEGAAVTFDANGGTGSFKWGYKFDGNITLPSTEVTRTGYTLLGWSKSQNASAADYNPGATIAVKAVIGNGTSATLYAVWQANDYNVTFDNLIDFNAWNKVAGNGTVSDVTDTGFTITSDSGVGESTSASPYFTIEPGKKYVIQMDIIGDNWDVYFFFCNENDGWVDFVDGPSTRVSSNRSANYFERNGNTVSSVFTVFDNSSIVKGQIRVDANGSGNTVRFENIRVSEAIDVSVSPVNKYVGYGETLGALPTPTRPGYEFAGWYSGNNEYTSSTVVKATSTVYLESKWTLSDAALVTDTYVLDFGMKAVFKPLDNDDILKADGASYKISGVSVDETNISTSVNGEYGTFTLVNDTTVEYVPASIMKATDTAYYHVTVGNKVLVGKMIVFPANVVYYEDDVNSAVAYTDGVATSGDTGKWTITGTSKLSNATIDLADKIYGYDNAYNNTDSFSMGSAHVVSVSKYNNPNSSYSGSEGNSWPYAEFTFAGTGFDVVSLISKDTGVVNVVVSQNGEQVYNWLIDTYYGYSYVDGKWSVTDTENALYQIPVIGKTDMPYGTYTVKIIPTYTSRLDHAKDGAYDFYIDAIRVYNPMQNDVDASTLYLNNGEYVVEHKAIRDILINAGSFGEGNGVVYINSTIEGTFENYSTMGPKNEVYLAKGQSVAFNMTVSGFKPTSVQVSAHALDGTAAMRFASGESYSDVTSISHKTTLYYQIPFMGADYWTDNGNGTYTLKNPIVITNNGEGNLSLCNIKVTSDTMTNVEPLMFMMSDDDFDNAVYAVNRTAGLTEDDGALFVPDDMTSGTDNDVVEKGKEVLVTINTSAEVYALTVNGEEATLVSTNDDGSKTWNYTFVTEKSGEQTFVLVAYDIHGFASEEQTVTVDVQSRIEIFFNKISLFFSMIVEFINTLFG